jgi:hypothetical protein
MGLLTYKISIIDSYPEVTNSNFGLVSKVSN